MVFVPWTCSILAGVSKGVNIKFQINVSLALTEKYLVNLPKAFEIKICCMHCLSNRIKFVKLLLLDCECLV